MRIKQRVYFRIWSQTTPASEVTARLGIEPDDFRVRGSQFEARPVPKGHQWSVNCDEPGLKVDDQIAKVVERLEPAAGKIAELVAELAGDDPPGFAVLQVVRYFDDDGDEKDSDHEIRLFDGTVLQSLSGQHHLLGWHLDSRTIAFLQAVGAELDVDESG